MFGSWRLPIMISCALHVIVGIVLFQNIDWQKKPAVNVALNAVQPVVKAEAVNRQIVENEIKRVEQVKLREEKARQAKIDKMNQAARAAQKKRQQEEQRMAQLKKQQLSIDAKKRADQKAQKIKQAELEALAKAQREARKKLADLTEKQRRAAEAVEKAQAQAKVEAALAEKKRQAEFAEREQAQLAKARRDKLRHVSEVDRYRAMIREAIRLYWVVPSRMDPDLTCQLLIRLAPGGDVLDVQLVQSSGNSVLDRSAKTAVLKASPLPVPDNPQSFAQFREIRLTVKPDGVMTAG